MEKGISEACEEHAGQNIAGIMLAQDDPGKAHQNSGGIKQPGHFRKSPAEGEGRHEGGRCVGGGESIGIPGFLADDDALISGIRPWPVDQELQAVDQELGDEDIDKESDPQRPLCKEEEDSQTGMEGHSAQMGIGPHEDLQALKVQAVVEE